MEFEGSLPIYQQITESIKGQIISGELKSGEKIKPVRDLAVEMGVNPNTMQKALAVLEAEGLVFSERTSGRFVTKDLNAIKELASQTLTRETEKFLLHMKQMGFYENEVEQAVKQAIKQ